MSRGCGGAVAAAVFAVAGEVAVVIKVNVVVVIVAAAVAVDGVDAAIVAP